MIAINGETVDIDFTRDGASDITGYKAYESPDGSAAIELQANVRVQVQFFSDMSRTTAFPISRAANTWHNHDTGISESEAETILNREIPPSKRLPDFDQTEANHYFIVNAAGTGLELSAATAADPSERQVYVQTKEIIEGGTGITVTHNDTNNSVTVAERAIQTGQSFPSAPVHGDRFNLLPGPTPIVVAFDPVATMVLNTTAEGDELVISLGANLPMGPHQIIAYAANWGDGAGGRTAHPASTTLRGRAFVLYNGTMDNLERIPSRLWIYREGAARPTAGYVVSTRLTVSGERDHFLITGLTYSMLGAGDWHRNMTYTHNNTKVYPDQTKTQGSYIYTNQEGWIFSPGSPAPWARQGQPAPENLAAVTELNSGAAQGLTCLLYTSPSPRD